MLRWRPGLITAWRPGGRLQLGLGENAVVISGLTAGEATVLAGLDDPCSLADLRERAARLGVDDATLRHLLDQLRDAGALAPEAPPPVLAPHQRAGGTPAAAAVLSLAHPTLGGWGVLEARHRASVRVWGVSMTALTLARTLAAGGVGAILLEDEEPVTVADLAPGGFSAGDVGVPRGTAAAALLALHHPQVRAVGRGGPDADVTVLLASGAVDLARADDLQRHGQRHLAVTWRGADVVVGPLVHPGASTCVRCVESHRTDRDPDWPSVLQQVRAAPGGRERPEEGALAALAGALTAAQVLADLDHAAGAAGPAVALDATVEVSLATASVARRPWSPHPRCGCTWPG